MGAIWVARHVNLGSQVAIKFLDPKLAASPSFVARFEREARAAASIQSPHVVQVHDFGVDEGTPYIAMELLRGEDLRTRIKRMGRLSLSTTAGLLVQVGKGLRRAHEAGIVHRDIKPGNLFLARVDDDEILKVLDFGIAKEPDSKLDEHTRTGELVGSPHYVSPEQARGDRDVDFRSDVWSLGVITFRMVTGELPFPGDGLGKVLSKVLVDPPPKVGALVPGLPGSLDGFFARALAKKREERFGSVRELVDAFVVLAQSEDSEDSVAPPSWSTIVNVSIPPAAPVPREAPLVLVVSGGAEAGGGAKGPVLPGPAGEGQSGAEPDGKGPLAAPASGKGPVAEQASFGAPAMGEVESADGGPPPSSRGGRRDSLTPSMGPNLSPRRPLVRLRWAAVAAVTASTLLTVGVAWWRDRSETAAGSADPKGAPGAAAVPGAASGGVDMPHSTATAARGPAAPSRGGTPPPDEAGPAPALPADPGAAPPAGATATAAGSAKAPPSPSVTPSGRPGAPPAPGTPGTRRKWGF